MWTPEAELVAELSHHRDAVTCLAHDGHFAFSGSEDAAICAWDLAAVSARPKPAQSAAPGAKAAPPELLRVTEPLFTLQGHSGPVSALLVLPESGRLASCGTDGVLLFWDYVAQAVTRKLEHNGQPMLSLAVRVDADEVLVGTQGGDILRFPLHVKPKVPPLLSSAFLSSACLLCPSCGSLCT